MLVTFCWARKPRALHVLREEGSDIRSGALIARSIGDIPMAACPFHCKQHRWDKWVSLARRWQRENSNAPSWLATSAELSLLTQHGATGAGFKKIRLLHVKVTAVILAHKPLDVVCLSLSW